MVVAVMVIRAMIKIHIINIVMEPTARAVIVLVLALLVLALLVLALLEQLLIF
jgi:hypothetical protein